MNKTAVIIIILIIAGAAVYFLTMRPRTNETNTQPIDTSSLNVPAVPSDTSASTTTDSSVQIKNFAFTPAHLIIKKGTTVTWTNADTAPHTVTSDSGKLLDSPTLKTGESFSFTFTAAGSFSYHCAVHPMMKGKITVTE